MKLSIINDSFTSVRDRVRSMDDPDFYKEMFLRGPVIFFQEDLVCEVLKEFFGRSLSGIS